jgi:phospholipid/cholesterol/gamma-HCH transport system substrate-binding protein
MSTEVKVGTFVTVSLIILGVALYYVHITQTLRGQVPYKTYFRNAGGLAPGAHVLFGGIKVGQIGAVKPSPEDPTRIEVLFNVKAGTPINEDSRARVSTVTLMSSPVLSITTGSKDARRLAPGAVVRSEETLTMDEIMRRVGAVADSANALLAGLRRDIPVLTGEAQNFIGNLNEMTGTRNQKHIASILAEVDSLLNRESPKIAQITDQISVLTKHADATVTSIDPVISNIDRTVTNVDKTVDSIREPLVRDLNEAQRTIEQAGTLLSSVQGMVGANQDNIDEMVRNLRVASANIRALTDEVKQRPWTLIRTQQQPERSVPK